MSEKNTAPPAPVKMTGADVLGSSLRIADASEIAPSIVRTPFNKTSFSACRAAHSSGDMVVYSRKTSWAISSR